MSVFDSENKPVFVPLRASSTSGAMPPAARLALGDRHLVVVK